MSHVPGCAGQEYFWRPRSTEEAALQSPSERDVAVNGVPLEFRELRYFVVLCEELHFSRAADRLHISQSPLSQAIAQLERKLGVRLLDRSSRHVALTPAGSVLLQHGRRSRHKRVESVEANPGHA